VYQDATAVWTSFANCSGVVPPTINFWNPGWRIDEDVGFSYRNPTTFRNGVPRVLNQRLISFTAWSFIFTYGAVG